MVNLAAGGRAHPSVRVLHTIETRNRAGLPTITKKVSETAPTTPRRRPRALREPGIRQPPIAVDNATGITVNCADLPGSVTS